VTIVRSWEDIKGCTCPQPCDGCTVTTHLLVRYCDTCDPIGHRGFLPDGQLAPRRV
jgi:hypothetical protein